MAYFRCKQGAFSGLKANCRLEARCGDVPCLGLMGRLAVKRWSIFALPFVMGAFMAVQSYAASRTWGIVNPNTIAIVALSVIGTLFLLGLVAAKRGRG